MSVCNRGWLNTEQNQGGSREEEPHDSGSTYLKILQGCLTTDKNQHSDVPEPPVTNNRRKLKIPCCSAWLGSFIFEKYHKWYFSDGVVRSVREAGSLPEPPRPQRNPWMGYSITVTTDWNRELKMQEETLNLPHQGKQGFKDSRKFVTIKATRSNISRRFLKASPEAPWGRAALHPVFTMITKGSRRRWCSD